MATIKLRRDTAANWTLADPVLAAGEPGIETDTGKVKYGDGTHSWSFLSYSSGGISSLADLSITASAPELNFVDGVTSAIQTQLDNKQPLDSDLTAWAGKTAPSGTAVGTNDSQTLTNKTIALGSNTVSGTTAQFNTANTDGDFATLAGSETLTNKTLTSPTLTTPALGTPSSGTLTSCTGLPVAGLTASTSTALGVGSIELGAASDTTLSRSSAGVLAVEGVNVVTTSSTDTLTNKTLTSPTLTAPVLGTPTSGTLTNCSGLPVSGITASTATAVGVGSVELGHASDTTLSRSSAGVLAVEGVTVPTISSTDTLTNKTLTSPTMTDPVLGTPASGTLTNCTGLPVSGIAASTATAVGLGTIELGHATDTTLSRAPGGGRLLVEGVNVVTASSTDTMSNKTLNSPTLVTPVLGTPSSGTLTSCTGLPISGLTASTSTALGVGSIELGAATDTTLSRSAAGVLAVEGVDVVTLSASQTLTNKTLTSPTLTGPALGTPASGTLTNCSGLPATGIASLTSSITELNYTTGVTSAIQTQFTNKQDLDSDLTAFAALSPSNDDFVQRKSGAWTSRTVVQARADLATVPGYVSGNYYVCNSLNTVGTSPSLSNSTVRVTSWLVRAPITITRLFADVSAVGQASCVFRIGIWNDDGTGKPGTLLLDAGTIPGDVQATAEVTVNQAMAAGVYWVGGAIQNASTTQPTMRTVSALNIENTFVALGTSLPANNLAFTGYVQSSVTGAFSNFTSSPTTGSACARIGFKVA